MPLIGASYLIRYHTIIGLQQAKRDRVENTVGKVKKILLIPRCFQKGYFPGLLKVGKSG